MACRPSGRCLHIGALVRSARGDLRTELARALAEGGVRSIEITLVGGFLPLCGPMDEIGMVRPNHILE